jgi:hypothetical protein
MDKFSGEELDELILHCLSTNRRGIFYTNQAHNEIFSKKDIDEIETMLDFINNHDETIIKKYPRGKTDYYNSYSIGPFAESFVNNGGFQKVFSENAIKEKGAIEFKNLEKESLKAAPKAVRSANRANIISIVAVAVAIVLAVVQIKGERKFEVLQEQIKNVQTETKILKDSLNNLQHRIKTIGNIKESKTGNK